MKVVFTDLGWDDYLFWAGEDIDVLRKVNALTQGARRTPFIGQGKPEALKGDLKGFWSRRITQEHRLVYSVDGKGPDQRITIVQCRYHY